MAKPDFTWFSAGFTFDATVFTAAKARSAFGDAFDMSVPTLIAVFATLPAFTATTRAPAPTAANAIPAVINAAFAKSPVTAYATADTPAAAIPIGPGMIDATDATSATTFMIDLNDHFPAIALISTSARNSERQSLALG